MLHGIRMTQPTWAYTPASAKNVFLRVVIRQQAVGVNEPLRLKLACVGVPFFIPRNSPKIHVSIVNVVEDLSDHMLSTTVAPDTRHQHSGWCICIAKIADLVG
jgi:hypothetical protein